MIEKEARLKVINLSRLEEIKDLRTVWPHEALDFTPWLSQDDNISLLADAVEMDITVDETESSIIKNAHLVIIVLWGLKKIGLHQVVMFFFTEFLDRERVGPLNMSTVKKKQM